LDCQIQGSKENIFVAFRSTAGGVGVDSSSAQRATTTGRGAGASWRKGKLERVFKINGLSQSSLRAVTHRLVTVSFKSHDLN
ncbi:hypothetical protein ABTF50_21100, partial [Acinetobacter baumannii]